MELSVPGGEGLVPRLSEEQVLRATEEQLRKDLALPSGTPSGGTGRRRLEQDLRRRCCPLLEEMPAHDRQVALYRVDVPESWTREAMAMGGLPGTGRAVVLRALQKVLTRMRFSSLGGDRNTLSVRAVQGPGRVATLLPGPAAARWTNIPT